MQHFHMFTAMSASEDDTEKILEEFYWLKQNLLKVNNEHDEIMDHCKNCIKIIERNSKNIKEQIRKYFLN